MSFSVNTNAGALAALRNLGTSTSLLDMTQTRVNTGLKVSSAKDNAAAFSIAQNLRADTAGYRAVTNSLNRAQSELDVAIAGAEAISDLLVEMKEKAVAAKDPGLDADSRNALNKDFLQLVYQIDSIASNAAFNGTNILTGDTSSAITDASGNNTISTAISGLTATDLDVGSTTITPSAMGQFKSFGTSDNAWGGAGSGDVDNSSAKAVQNYMTENASAIEAKYDAANGAGSYAAASYTFDSDTGEFSGTNFPQIVAAVGSAMNDTYFAGASKFSSFDKLGDSSKEMLYLNTTDNFYVVRNGDASYFTTNGADVTIDQNISTSTDASAIVSKIETAISSVNDILSQLGSASNRLNLQATFSNTVSNSLEVGIGNLVDADMAKESANLTAYQTRQQLGLQALSIANQAPQTVLSLFR